MPTHTWTIKLEEVYAASKKHWDKLKLLREVDRRAYFEGFKVGREKKMFQEELKDLEITYKAALLNLSKQEGIIMPSLLYHLEEFLNVHKKVEAVREKLDTLLAKTGRCCEEEEEEDE